MNKNSVDASYHLRPFANSPQQDCNFTYCIYDLLDYPPFRKRPGMYIGGLNVKNMSIYLAGYQQAMMYHAKDISNPDFHRFHDWVARKFHFPESTAGWANMILASILGLSPEDNSWSWEDFDAHANDQQQKKAVDLFFVLLDEFRHEAN